MLAKVGAHGIAGDLLEWINDWTKGRRQRVVLNGENSEWIKVTSSVVQGSVLGPVLFLMYINCLDIAVRAHDDQILVSKFADDSKIGRAIRHPKDTESLQQAIENLTKWCDKWGMEIHPEKSLVIHFGQNNQNADYKIGHTRVAAVECARDLGVYINNSCSSSEHVSYIAKKAHRVLSQLRRATTLRDSTFAKLYQVYVRPLMEASAPAWNPTKREDVNTLEKVQRRALRMVTSLGAATYEEKLSILGMQSLDQIVVDVVIKYSATKSSVGPVTLSQKIISRSFKIDIVPTPVNTRKITSSSKNVTRMSVRTFFQTALSKSGTSFHRK